MAILRNQKTANKLFVENYDLFTKNNSRHVCS